MKKAIILLILSISIHLKAQDRILTIRKDTLLAKITSVDKQNVAFYLETDKDKKVTVLPITDLHKIIWRSGLEYIINKELDEKLKKDFPAKTPSNISKPIQEKANVVEATNQNKNQFDDAPEIGYRRIFGGHRVNGKIKKSKEVIEILKKYDSDAYNHFYDGQELLKQNRKFYTIGVVVNAGVLLSQIQGPMPFLLRTGGYGLQVLGIVKFYQSKRAFRDAIDVYNFKRENRLFKPQMILKAKL